MNPLTHATEAASQPPALALEMIQHCSLGPHASIIDIGGGSSALAGRLLSLGFDHISVLDVAADSLFPSQRSLGADSGRVRWIEDDVTRFDPPQPFSLWYDFAVLRRLDEARQRRCYWSALRRALKPGGYFLAAFAAADMRLVSEELKADYRLLEEAEAPHEGLQGSKQPLKVALFQSL